MSDPTPTEQARVTDGARFAGYMEGLRCAMIIVRMKCTACRGSGKEQEPDGSATECEYCGRPIAAIREALTTEPYPSGLSEGKCDALAGN